MDAPSTQRCLSPGLPVGRFPTKPRISFSSAHSIVDFSNGASVATLDVLHGLAADGFECQAFCTPKLDFQSEVCFENVVAATRELYQVRQSACGSGRARVLYTRRQQVPITIIRLESTRHVYKRAEEIQTVLEFFQKFLDVNRPDVMLTYGGDPITMGMIAEAKRREIPVVFVLHNFAYTNPRVFSNVDYCIVASEFARRHYRDRVGLACDTLPYAMDWERVRAEDREPRFVTFINPCAEKGVYAFARIAHELGRRRPDIPLLVVESRGTAEHMAACGLDLSACNLKVMPHTTDPRTFWRVTRIALMPSLWWENQPLVAIEAMINGIPVIGSNRGGIPETLGESGFALPLPNRLTPLTKIVPSAEEVEPWVETIIRLWDDRALFEAQSTKARTEAERWRPERVRPLYAEFFRNVHHQPGAPIMSKTRAGNVEQRSQGANGTGIPKPNGQEIPMSFVVCVSDGAVLKANLLRSPGLVGPDSPHEVILIHKAPSAAAGLNMGLERAKHEWVVCLHEDVHLPEGWDRLLTSQLRQAERQFGKIGVAGVYGVGLAQQVGQAAGRAVAPEPVQTRSCAQRIGWVVDRGRLLRDGPELPSRVATLDELLLVVRRDAGHRFDPELGFHLYGADICLQAHERGLAVVALAAPCDHDSGSAGLPREFFASAAVFARKWAHRLPVATPCAIIASGGAVHIFGNATDRPASISPTFVNRGPRLARRQTV